MRASIEAEVRFLLTFKDTSDTNNATEYCLLGRVLAAAVMGMFSFPALHQTLCYNVYISTQYSWILPGIVDFVPGRRTTRATHDKGNLKSRR